MEPRVNPVRNPNNSRRLRPGMRCLRSFSYREFALAGGLMSYYSSVGYLYHQEAGGPACHPTDQI
jgi:hypothetical protein